MAMYLVKTGSLEPVREITCLKKTPKRRRCSQKNVPSATIFDAVTTFRNQDCKKTQEEFGIQMKVVGGKNLPRRK